MVHLLGTPGPLTEHDIQELKPILRNVQGNILRAHGRNRSVHILLHFKHDTLDPEKTKIKKWISHCAQHITSAQRQLEESHDFRAYNIPGRLFCSFFLSATGYRFLGLEPPGERGHESFKKGMASRVKKLNDPQLKDWGPGYQEDIHAMLLLADDDEHFLLRVARNYLEAVKAFAKICVVEHGNVMRNEHDQRVEHFGYVDGRSQPLFFEKDVEKERQENGGTSTWNPGAAPHVVLVKDPYGNPDGRWTPAYGSYFVYRKLKQDVEGFRQRIKDLAAKLEGTQTQRQERAEALVMGRFRDGTPVVACHRASGGPGPIPNDFDFHDDRAGQKCPIQSHIRLMNSREMGKPAAPLIVRRSIPYGQYRKAQMGTSPDVGLLFMCYQRNIFEQFEQLQDLWANNSIAPDPIIGQKKKGQTYEQKWPVNWDDTAEKHISFDFHSFVDFKGGEYFFVPSIRFLKILAKIPSNLKVK